MNTNRLRVVEKATVIATEVYGQPFMTVINLSAGGGVQEDFCAQVPGLRHVWIGKLSGSWGAEQMYQIVADSGGCRDVGYFMFQGGVVMWSNHPASGGIKLWTCDNGNGMQLAQSRVELIGGVWMASPYASAD